VADAREAFIKEMEDFHAMDSESFVASFRRRAKSGKLNKSYFELYKEVRKKPHAFVRRRERERERDQQRASKLFNTTDGT
jgi:hypothetical protein